MDVTTRAPERASTWQRHRTSVWARTRRAGWVAAATTVAALLLLTGPRDQQAQAQAPGCQFILGFATLRALIGAATVGQCLEDQRFAANGNAEQQTTGGLLVWRKADNWTAFTNGFETWLNGPQGLQRRVNTTRFSWEGDAISMQQNRFSPASLTVAPGTTLTWINLDREDHDVVHRDLAFESPLVGPGGSWQMTFEQPG